MSLSLFLGDIALADKCLHVHTMKVFVTGCGFIQNLVLVMLDQPAWLFDDNLQLMPLTQDCELLPIKHKTKRLVDLLNHIHAKLIIFQTCSVTGP